MAFAESDFATSREFTPEQYPPFPPDLQPYVELQTIKLAAIAARAPCESARLLAVCKKAGFFYLDLSDTDASNLIADAEAIGRLSEELFKLPIEEKMKYPFGRKPYSILGYKPAGYTKADAHGSAGDTAELFNIGKDDIMDIPGRVPTDLPAMLLKEPNRSLLSRFQGLAHATGTDILSALATSLGLSPDVFGEMHRLDRPTDSHARVLRGPARKSADNLEIQTPGHTDFGSITLLFNWLGGLQIWSQPNHGENFDNSLGSDLGPESNRHGQWLWVKPKPRHAIINLGDCTVKHTGGILCAGRHRVLPAPGEQRRYPRYSVVYFVRPADDHIVQRLSGGEIPLLKDGEEEEKLTANQWATKQFKGLVEGKGAQERGSA